MASILARLDKVKADPTSLFDAAGRRRERSTRRQPRPTELRLL